MSIQWAGLGPELLLRLDRTLPEPLGSQLEGGLREAIRSGRLQAEGYLSTRVGSATRGDRRHPTTPAVSTSARSR